VQTDRQTDTIRQTDATERSTCATANAVVGNKNEFCLSYVIQSEG